jgi:hypothetical protein
MTFVKNMCFVYPTEFECRIDYLFDQPVIIERLLFVSLRTPAIPYCLSKMAEIYE